MKKDNFELNKNQVIMVIKRLCPTFGFVEMAENIYMRKEPTTIYMSFNDEHIVVFNASNAFHMSYDDLLKNIALYMEDSSQGFNERTFFNKVLQALEN